MPGRYDEMNSHACEGPGVPACAIVLDACLAHTSLKEAGQPDPTWNPRCRSLAQMVGVDRRRLAHGRDAEGSSMAVPSGQVGKRRRRRGAGGDSDEPAVSFASMSDDK